jgi:hypothetical protein
MKLSIVKGSVKRSGHLQVERLPPVGEDDLRGRAGQSGGKRAGMAIFHDFVIAPETLAAQGQSAGRPSRCRPQRFVSNRLDILHPVPTVFPVNGVVV